MAYFLAAPSNLDSEQLTQLFLRNVFCLYSMPQSVISDKDLHLRNCFRKAIFKILDTKLLFLSAYHPQTNGQTERMNHTHPRANIAHLYSAGSYIMDYITFTTPVHL